jgi:hypothetical protein
MCDIYIYVIHKVDITSGLRTRELRALEHCFLPVYFFTRCITAREHHLDLFEIDLIYKSKGNLNPGSSTPARSLTSFTTMLAVH